MDEYQMAQLDELWNEGIDPEHVSGDVMRARVEEWMSPGSRHDSLPMSEVLDEQVAFEDGIERASASTSDHYQRSTNALRVGGILSGEKGEIGRKSNTAQVRRRVD